jgi:hypothetical protein
LSTAAGGVWKSSNGGGTWKSVFDDQPVSSIGSVALASGNPNIVYVAYSLGPILTGFISEQLEPTMGDESLRYALVVASVSLQVWAAWHFYRAAATLKEDYARAAAF